MSSMPSDQSVAVMPRLLVHREDGPPRVYPLYFGRPNAIGRASECEVRLIDEHCSRRHCLLQSDGGQWQLTDLGSRNGTIVNGQRVHRHAMEEGDVIVIGGTWLVFTQTDGDASALSGDSVSTLESDTRLNMQSTDTARMPRSVPQPPPPQRRPVEPMSYLGDVEDTYYADRTMAWGRRPAMREDVLIGESHALQAVRKQIENVSATDSTVLIRGESGVGKELVALSIHLASRRRRGPFVCVNCAALSESLLESELFGHERGAFIGATEARRGKFEQAHRGTILLDEVGEMGPSMQARFLRVLEGFPFERVGGQFPIQADVRVIATTNLDLEAAVQEGRFRKDLYYRLNVLPIEVPPLRVRRADIPVLARHFLARSAEQTGQIPLQFTPNAIEKLKAYDWPGNVRELKNILERCLISVRGDAIDSGDLDLDGPGAAPVDESRYEGLSIESVEMQHIVRTLKQTRWNKSRAAAILGIERSTLDRKLKRHDINRPD
jgi:DNA-binding NtrC family response regulator/pSer/pThr/pTyr-binding forkhead associated (FHA) protein